MIDSSNIKKLLREAMPALPCSLESDIQTIKGTDAIFDEAAPGLIETIGRLRFAFSEIDTHLAMATPDWKMTNRCLAEAKRLNSSLLLQCLAIDEDKNTPYNLRGAGDALFFYEDTECLLPIMTAVRALTDIIYDLGVEISECSEAIV
jgi:hypothetical protein